MPCRFSRFLEECIVSPLLYHEGYIFSESRAGHMFLDEYQVIDFFGPLNSDFSVLARHTTSQDVHVLHVLAGGDRETNQSLIDTVSTLPDDARRYVIGASSHRTIPVMVTHPLPGGVTAREWLQPYLPDLPFPRAQELTKAADFALPLPVKESEVIPPATPATAKTQTGEFTRYMRAVGVEQVPKPLVPEVLAAEIEPTPARPVTPASVPPPAFNPLPEERGADKTQVFSVPDLQSRAMSMPAAAVSPADQVRNDVLQDGRLDQQDSQKSAAKPGEFTQFMNSLEPSRSPAPLGSGRRDAPALTTVPEFRDERGGFTELLDRANPARTEMPGTYKDDVSFMRSGANPHDATRVFDASPEQPSKGGAAKSPQVQHGPGEYTQAIERGRRPAALPVTPSSAKPEKQLPAKRPVLVIVGVVLAVILLTLLVLVMAQAS